MPLLLPELLCPAGDETALRAAVDRGANAVYLGYRVFGARARRSTLTRKRWKRPCAMRICTMYACM